MIFRILYSKVLWHGRGVTDESSKARRSVGYEAAEGESGIDGRDT